MSLFPAYSDLPVTSKGLSSVEEKSSSWLNNSSFSVAAESNVSKDIISAEKYVDEGKCLNSSNSDENDHCEKRFKAHDEESQNDNDKSSRSHEKSRKKKKRKKEKKRRKENKNNEKFVSCRVNDRKLAEPLTDVPGLFYTDKIRQPGNLSVDTLYRPAVPLYNPPKRKFILLKKKSTKKDNSKKYRYYTCIYERDEKSDINRDNDLKETELCGTKEVGVSCEKEITEKTRQFNEKLEHDPNNVKLWLDYVKFQDTVCKYEQQVHKFSKSSARKASTEKKIAILEKALSLNPLCEELLNEKFILAESVYPPGKLLNEATELLNKDKTNLTLCRTVIRCSQFNLARCTAPGVMKAFSDALERLHQTRMRHLNNKDNETIKNITKIILVLLLECGLFMRQAGLWEQLLMLLKQYLEINVSTFVNEFHEFYKFEVNINEESIYNAEETILKSNLPLSAIWLRIERLREACYWLPYSNPTPDEDKNIDPQRLVFTEDIRYLIQPVIPSSLNLHLVIIVMHLLKVPLLPSTNMLYEILRLNEIQYVLDDVESLLSVFYPIGLVPVKRDAHFLKDIDDLISGPQYLKDKLGKSEFLSLLGIIFESAARQLREADSVVLCSWYLRFNRYLICLSGINGNITYSDSYKKKIKKFAKDKLKEPQFRNELQLYNEYALLERDFGNESSCLNVLNTAVKFRRFTYEKATYVTLYRNNVETLLRSNPIENRTKAVEVLCMLVDCKNVETATEKFMHVNTEARNVLLQSMDPEKEIDLIDVMTPHWFVEWVACHSYFLMLTKSIWVASGMVQEIIDSLLPNIAPCTIGKHVCEGLYEILVSIIHFHCQQTNTSFHVLQCAVQSAHEKYTNNVYFLHVSALIETYAGSAGSPWWKLSSFFTKSTSVLPRLFLVFILRHRISVSLVEGGWTDTSAHNLMLSLLNHLINENVSKRCPLIWRLYLQFLSVSKGGADLKKAFYRAVEECPWVKALYVDAIQLLPESIEEIQDLLIEKELRLHSIMDELDILRSDSI